MLIDPSGRGPTMRQLYVAGIAMIVVIALALTLLILRYTGFFDKDIPITAVMKTTGDGLSEKADVKYRGVLVGEVDKVETVEGGQAQNVFIALKPEYADQIPANVTARTVPSNVFAVNSVELLAPQNASTKPLDEGSEIVQDNSAETIALQSTLTDLREVLKAIQPERLGRILTSVSGGLDPQGRVPGSSLERLDRVLAGIDTGTPTGQDLLSRTRDGFAAINVSAPELVTVLESTVQTSLTFTEKQAQFENLLFAGVYTMDANNDFFARNPNSGIVLVQNADKVFGAIASDPKAVLDSIPALDGALAGILGSFKYKRYYGQPYSNLLANISFTPFTPYRRDDCPRYGDLAGPSCNTAPYYADPGYLPKQLWPHTLDSAKDAGMPDGAAPPNPLAPFLPPAPNATPGAPAAKAPQANMPSPLPWLVPPAPGTKPAAANKPASFTTPAAFAGPVAVAALLGRAPSTIEYLLLSTALQGGVLEFTPAKEGAV